MFEFLSSLSQDMELILVPANTLVHVKGKGIVIREPSVVAVQKDTNEVLAISGSQKNDWQNTWQYCRHSSLKDGVIADLT